MGALAVVSFSDALLSTMDLRSVAVIRQLTSQTRKTRLFPEAKAISRQIIPWQLASILIIPQQGIIRGRQYKTEAGKGYGSCRSRQQACMWGLDRKRRGQGKWTEWLNVCDLPCISNLVFIRWMASWSRPKASLLTQRRTRSPSLARRLSPTSKGGKGGPLLSCNYKINSDLYSRVCWDLSTWHCSTQSL